MSTIAPAIERTILQIVNGLIAIDMSRPCGLCDVSFADHGGDHDWKDPRETSVAEHMRYAAGDEGKAE